MRILVTGGAGFIGSHLVDKLIEKGHQTFVVDNLSTGKKENLNPEAEFIQSDITDSSKIEKIFENKKPEIVYHLAAQIDVRRSVNDPIFDTKTNILGSLNLINISVKHNVKKFIFSSSGGAAYGDVSEIPTSENCKEIPISPYGIAKLTVDNFLYYYHTIHGLNYISLRYGNVYGPRQNPHGEAGVIGIFINKMLKNEQTIINGDGRQTRDYIFVNDVVEANIIALEYLKKIGVFNVGTATEKDLNNIFSELNKNFSNKFTMQYGPAKLGEQRRSCLNYSKIKSEFGWEPRMNFSEGIKLTINWFKNNYKIL
jgi:UDP-glucose 4-epimerase